MKHYQIISHPYRPERPRYQIKRKRLAAPIIDIICIAALALVLWLTGYLHVRIGLYL